MKQAEKSLYIDGSTTLTIDTTGDVGKVCLNDNCVTWQAQGAAEVVLEKIDALLKKHRVKITEITDVKVNPGPGSFTGTRVGVTVANTLAWTLKKSINRLPKGNLVRPAYSAPPKISQPKNKKIPK